MILDELREKARSLGERCMAVAGAEEPAVLGAACRAAGDGFVRPVLLGKKAGKEACRAT